MQLSQLIPVLQIAIGPVILISGVGLLLLTLANRFGRAVDRARQLLREMRVTSGEERKRLARQVENLHRRAVLIQLAIIYGVLSVLFVALLIITLFIAVQFKIELAILVEVLFIGCLLSLIISLVTFILDIRLSLQALKLEMGHENADSAS